MSSEDDFKAMAVAVYEKFGDDQDLDLKAFAHIEDQIQRPLLPIEKATIRYFLDQTKSGQKAIANQEQKRYDPDKMKDWV